MKVFALVEDFAEAWSDVVPQGVQAAICPPLVYVRQAASTFPEVVWGRSQDCSEHEQGAFTGEVSASMIAETGAHYCASLGTPNAEL